MNVVNPISDMVSMMRSKGLMSAQRTFYDDDFKVTLKVESTKKCLNTMFKIGNFVKFINSDTGEKFMGYVNSFKHCESTGELKSVVVEWKYIGSNDLTEFPIEYAYEDLKVVK